MYELVGRLVSQSENACHAPCFLPLQIPAITIRMRPEIIRRTFAMMTMKVLECSIVYLEAGIKYAGKKTLSELWKNVSELDRYVRSTEAPCAPKQGGADDCGRGAHNLQ